MAHKSVYMFQGPPTTSSVHTQLRATATRVSAAVFCPVDVQNDVGLVLNLTFVCVPQPKFLLQYLVCMGMHITVYSRSTQGIFSPFSFPPVVRPELARSLVLRTLARAHHARVDPFGE